ncbi:hypothetical protein SAMN06296020_1123 [Anoxynatronum buryatiense]|uniref:Uncharacterized protein n=1 Tax=Anoxynatronum buryatiense TaxID=489973 RepID=A0AA45WXK4_9CLOT|nr:hypothetical protein SAMN06296020_1123 [Anoxynatronum buryatiense]
MGGASIKSVQRGFNPRSRTGSDLRAKVKHGFADWFQSTLPHGERPMINTLAKLKAEVSIHAPARGATTAAAILFPPRAVSIHAPARGATQDGDRGRGWRRSFNPRSRTGSDQGSHTDQSAFYSFNPRSRTGSDPPPVVLMPLATGVSIHAPARGATADSSTFRVRHTVSIHAPARGATSSSSCDMACKKQFQSTLPHGERLNFQACTITGGLFQSTLPHGERLRAQVVGHLPDGVSIHAPARGATFCQ